MEIENLHDDALKFEAIHRVVFGVDPEKLIAAFKEFYPNAHREAHWSSGVTFLRFS